MRFFRFGKFWPRTKGRMGVALAAGLLLGAALGAGGCADRQRRNPLDPRATGVEAPSGLQSRALDGRVELEWDYGFFNDIEGYRLYRRLQGGEFARFPPEDLPASAQAYTDSQVTNEETYEYRLGLLVRGEGEVDFGDVRRATPGAGVPWVADRGSGLVWRLCADGRSACGAQGVFGDMRGIGVDRRSASLWVSDGFFSGLARVDTAAQVELLAAGLEEPGALSIDPERPFGWVADRATGAVYWFETEGPTASPPDSLRLTEADANFRGPFLLAATDGRCWIVDRGDGRAILYERDGGRRVEWRRVGSPVAVAATRRAAWVLAEEGAVLLRLDDGGGALEIELPFGRGTALAVDRSSGECWVMGEGDIASYASSGALTRHWPDVPGGLGLAVDGRRRQVWVATGGTVWKFSYAGENLARLTGFATPSLVEVRPD